MGNYNGTIRCGYCYERGHNSRTCPTKLERMEKRLAAAKNDGAHESYYAHAVAKMTGTNPETGEKVKRRYEGRGRDCSYCKDGGHNRRTCPVLKSHKAQYDCMTRDVRLNVRQWAQEEGVGTGAMIMYKDYYSNDSVLMMVEAIHLHKVHARQRFYEATVRPMGGNGRKQTITIKPSSERQSEQAYTATYKVVGPLTAEQIAAQISEDWAHEEIDYKNTSGLSNNPFEKGKQQVHHFWHDVETVGFSAS